MKKGIITSLWILVGLLLFESCSKSSSVNLPGSWTKLADFAGVPRSDAVGFVINNVAYVGTGYNYSSNVFLQDFWKYDLNSDSWQEVAAFPGDTRAGAVAFTLNGKGYVGTGYNLLNGSINSLSDFWEFDPSSGPTGQWSQISNLGFPAISNTASARSGAMAFTVNDHAFVSCGNNSNVEPLNDLWEYDQPNNQWIQRPDLVGSPRQNGFAMVINNGKDDIAYIGGGNSGGVLVSDFLKFDVTKLLANSQPWTALKELKGNSGTPSPRESASTFSIKGYGYLTCGINGSALGDLWRYNPINDSWSLYSPISDSAPIPGAARESSVGFVVGGSGFLTTGGSGSIKYDDSWQFNPAK